MASPTSVPEMSQRVCGLAGLYPLSSASSPTVMVPPTFGVPDGAMVWLAPAPRLEVVPPAELELLLEPQAAARKVSAPMMLRSTTHRRRVCADSTLISPPVG